MTKIQDGAKAKKKQFKMYGFNALEKVIVNCEKKEAQIRKEKSIHIELLNKRFFDFLMSIFYEYRDNGISLLFSNNEKELKLMDLKRERTYWLIFDDKVSGKKMEYLVHGYVSSCTIIPVYEKIVKEVFPLYEKNKAIYERKEFLRLELEKSSLKKEQTEEKNGRGKI